MARQAKLKAVYLKSHDSWAINVPASLSETGKRRQLFFETKGEATTECEKLKARKDNFGTSLVLLSPTQITEAANAYQMLKPYGIGLLDAVREHLFAHKQRMSSITFLDLCDRYLSAKAHRDDKHLRGLRNTRDRFPSLHAILISDIDHKILEPLANAVAPGSRNMVLRHLRSFFNFGIKKGFMTENPVARLDFVEVVRKEVEVIAAKDVARMLADALLNDLQLVPFLALGFFTGIRPEEIRLMNWGDIDIATKGVTIRPEVSKTRKRRFPELSDNAIAWLKAYGLAGGKTEGPIIALQEDALFAHRQKNRLAAGVVHWPNSGMRHSFCSYWLAKNLDVNKLVLLSGHDSPDTMWKNYHRGVTASDAEKFWSIVPQGSAKNIVPFEKVSAQSS
jgi:integrase